MGTGVFSGTGVDVATGVSTSFLSEFSCVFPSEEALGRVPDQQFVGWYVYPSGAKEGEADTADAKSWYYGDIDGVGVWSTADMSPNIAVLIPNILITVPIVMAAIPVAAQLSKSLSTSIRIINILVGLFSGSERILAPGIGRCRHPVSGPEHIGALFCRLR